MLGRSQKGHILLMCALTPDWPDGSASGLRALCGVAVVLVRAKGALDSANQRSGQTYAVRVACVGASVKQHSNLHAPSLHASSLHAPSRLPDLEHVALN